jgi:uncharacterized protein YfaP (DUF2135 family)
MLPPPPPSKRGFRLYAIILVLVALLLIPAVLIYSGILPGMFNSSNPTPSPFVTSSPTPFASPSSSSVTNSPTATPQVTVSPFVNLPNTVSFNTGSKVSVASSSVGASGGTIAVTDSSSPLYGLKIVVPETATTEPVQFDVSYSTVSSVSGLEDQASVASKLIAISTSGSDSWNLFKVFDKPVEVTFPYDANAANNDNAPVRFYWYDGQTGKLDATGFLSEDKTAHTITFLSASFSDFVAIKLDLNFSELLGVNYSVDTGFRPSSDGWFIPNYGSYLTPGGMCLGMVSYAKWYFSYMKGGNGIGLYDKYIEGTPTEWRDDNTAIQLAARAHLGTSGIWSALTTQEYNWATSNAREVAISWLHGMIVTDEPQLIGLKARSNNGTYLDYAHAVMTYGYSNGMFEIYDPNFPGSSSGDRMREIPFTYTNGFNETYVSGKTRADNLVFNIFYHAGSKMAATPSAYTGLYLSAEKKFTGDSEFPTVTLTDTSTVPAGTTPVDSDGDGIRDTPQNTAVISGTITGGQSAINSTLVFVSNHKYTVRVENGAFSQEVPLYNGDNDIIVLATDQNTLTNWAGFLQDTIRSNTTVASLTITLTWGQDNSDVDLHVLEPGNSGRHIYYNNPGYFGANPYLDLDNTHGYGPEHYYATESMTLPESTNLYGTYQIRVNYYADHDGNTEQTQPITWHLNVRYLAFKNVNTGQEFWVEESRSGALSTEDNDNTSDFYNASPAWSNVWTIEYTQPNLQDYAIPPPPQNVLPP